MPHIMERQTQDGRKRYTVVIRRRGHPAQSATFGSKTKAKTWARNTEAAISEGRHFKAAESKKHTVVELIDRYIETVLPEKSGSTEYSQGIQLRWWRKHLGGYVLADVTPALLVEHRDKLAGEPTPRGPKRSPATVVRYMAALSHAFTTGMKEWGWLDDNPMRFVSKPREGKGRVRFLDDDERVRLLDACRESRNPDLYTVVVLALSTGMRKGEILGLTWKDIDLDRGIISITDSKNRESRAVPVTGHAHELLTARAKFRRIDTGLVFPAPADPRQKPRPIDIQSAWDWAVERAKLEDFRFHDLRHCAATYLAQSGASLSALAATLGHKTLQMVQRYQHLTAEHTSPVVEKMNRRIFGPEANGARTEGE